MKESDNCLVKGFISLIVGIGAFYLSFYLRSRLDEIYQAKLALGDSTPPLQMVGISLIIMSVVGIVYGGYMIIEGYHLWKRENVSGDYHPLKK